MLSKFNIFKISISRLWSVSANPTFYSTLFRIEFLVRRIMARLSRRRHYRNWLFFSFRAFLYDFSSLFITFYYFRRYRRRGAPKKEREIKKRWKMRKKKVVHKVSQALEWAQRINNLVRLFARRTGSRGKFTLKVVLNEGQDGGFLRLKGRWPFVLVRFIRNLSVYALEASFTSLFKLNAQVSFKGLARFLSRIAAIRTALRAQYLRVPFRLKKRRYVSTFIKLFTVSLILTASFHFIINAIARELPKRKKQVRILYTVANLLRSLLITRQEYRGFRLVAHGTIGRHGRTKQFYYNYGVVSLQRYSAPVFYTMRHCRTRFGAIGIHLWLAFYNTKKR